MLSMACMALPALAQVVTSESALPDAPSANSTAVAVAGIGATDHSLTFGERTHAYARAVFSPMTIIGPAFAAGIGQCGR